MRTFNQYIQQVSCLLQTNNGNMQAGQIFFSYSRNDAKFALKLAEDLRKAGVDIWIDQIDIRPSEPWDEEIQKALDESNCILVILSNASVVSENVLNEVNYGMENKKQVLPILIDKNINKPFNIRRLQHIDFTVSYENGLNQLLKSWDLQEKNIVRKKPTYRYAILISAVIVIGALTLAFLKFGFYNAATVHHSGLTNKDAEILKTNSSAKAYPINVSGKWITEERTNPFDEHDKYTLTFDFNISGNLLVGTIDMVSAIRGKGYHIKKGILEGKILDSTISFCTTEQSILGAETVIFKNLYNGSVSRNEIKFNLQSDRPWGMTGQEFTAKRFIP